MKNGSSKTLYLISTAPPTECGIATFSENLITSFHNVWDSSKLSLKRIPLHYEEEEDVFSNYQLKICRTSNNAYREVAEKLNQDPDCVGVILQHEFGLYGDNDGHNILTFFQTYTGPVFTTFHTILRNPSPNQKFIMEEIGKRSSFVTVMIQGSKDILSSVYNISSEKIRVVPHGIPYVPFSSTDYARAILGLPNSKTFVLTFGLLGPGKGIENVIEAVAHNVTRFPDLHYLIVGSTHPNVAKQSGESYRNSLLQKAADLGITNHIHFINQFVSEKDLLTWIQASDLYICPPQNPEQASSGTLSYALGSGRPVLASNFAHALDAVTEDRGKIFQIGNVEELSEGLKELLSDPNGLYRLGKQSYYGTREWLWNNVAICIGNELKPFLSAHLFDFKVQPLKLDKLISQTDEIGLWQFGKLNEKNLNEGYTLDDNARAAIVVDEVIGTQSDSMASLQGMSLLEVYGKFIRLCFASPRSVHNYITGLGKPDFDRNSSENLEDARSRGIWALGTLLSNSKLSRPNGELLSSLWNDIINHEDFVTPEAFPRSIAYTGIGIIRRLEECNFSDEEKTILETALKNRLEVIYRLLKESSEGDWNWYEKSMTYSNGILPQFHIEGAEYFKNDKEIEAGLTALNALYERSVNGEVMSPIGQDGWLEQKGEKALFDQQPEEPAHLSLACSAAYEATGDILWHGRARNALSWFYGNNLHGLQVYNPETGSVFDGMTRTGLNLNEGAESLVMYLMALIKFNSLKK